MDDLVADLRRVARSSGEGPAASVRQRGPAAPWLTGAAGLVVLAALGLLVASRFRPPAAPTRGEYAPLTNFADSATSPALSSDGRMLAFIRGESTFYGPGQVYVKLLPDGEPVQLTRDDFDKMSPAFTPDGSRITYTVFTGASWDTWVVPVLDGQPRTFLENAAALTWIPADAGQPRLLFSEVTGRDVQMAIVSSTESRAKHRVVYMPPETGMAHRSYLSPDSTQVLVIEMSYDSWLPCRLAPFDGSSPGRRVGPQPAQCTDAAWSPDGKWMYFTANTGSGFHIWRQRYPDGAPEQMTSGVTEEEGIAVAPDGRSFVTSIGTRQSTIWVHDARGDRQITSEGYGLLPTISADGKKLFYMQRGLAVCCFTSGELWVADLDTGRTAAAAARFSDAVLRRLGRRPAGGVRRRRRRRAVAGVARVAERPYCAAPARRPGRTAGLVRGRRRRHLRRQRRPDELDLSHQTRRHCRAEDRAGIQPAERLARRPMGGRMAAIERIGGLPGRRRFASGDLPVVRAQRNLRERALAVARRLVARREVLVPAVQQILVRDSFA